MELDAHITVDSVFIDPGDSCFEVETLRNEHILCSVFSGEFLLDLSREFLRELEFSHRITK